MVRGSGPPGHGTPHGPICYIAGAGVRCDWVAEVSAGSAPFAVRLLVQPRTLAKDITMQGSKTIERAARTRTKSTERTEKVLARKEKDRAIKDREMAGRITRRTSRALVGLRIESEVRHQGTCGRS